ncbi:MAG: hypothetical protein CL555_05950 [Algoriphagus sp.]|nr:hypothetical protein [Algoriphagus sp.]QDP64431.1 MAG: hypothetical protein Tp156MES38741_22 [Prokaryotic dsDNA virus sp.]|tara:strand:- start:295 stop:612 length:318 start_codon:yes stop_codon:yes gene_type:complete
MSVYIVTAPSVGMAKIGFAHQVYRRFYALKTGSPVPLILAAIIPSDAGNERHLQKRFEDQWSHGEWFRITPEILELCATFGVEKQNLRAPNKRPRFRTIMAGVSA